MISNNDIEKRGMLMPKKAMEILTESMFYVLMAFSKGPMCGIDVADFIEKRTKGRVLIGPATLYTILGKFEKEKWIMKRKWKDGKGLIVSRKKDLRLISRKWCGCSNVYGMRTMRFCISNGWEKRKWKRGKQ